MENNREEFAIDYDKDSEKLMKGQTVLGMAPVKFVLLKNHLAVPILYSPFYSMTERREIENKIRNFFEKKEIKNLNDILKIINFSYLNFAFANEILTKTSLMMVLKGYEKKESFWQKGMGVKDLKGLMVIDWYKTYENQIDLLSSKIDKDKGREAFLTVMKKNDKETSEFYLCRIPGKGDFVISGNALNELEMENKELYCSFGTFTKTALVPKGSGLEKGPNIHTRSLGRK